MHDDSEREDLEWIDLVRRGQSQEQAFAALYRKYSGLILGFLRRKGLESEAADFAQDVFLSAFRDLASFEGRSTFRTWLVAIAANRCRQEWARLGRHKRKGLLVEMDSEDGRSLEETLTSRNHDPEGAALDKENRGRLEQAVGELPPRMRQCWRLREQGHDLKTIAALLKVQDGTVKTQLHNARETLAAKLFPGDASRSRRPSQPAAANDASVGEGTKDERKYADG